MSTITKEWLQQKIANMETARDEIPFGLGEDGTNTLEALRIALESLEAEAVAEVCEGFTLRYIGHGPAPKSGVHIGDRLFTAPLAPVSVPDEMTPKQASRSYCGEVRGYRDGWNACRAAMLQGADGNSPVIPDGWVMVPVDATRAMIDAAARVEEDGYDAMHKAMIAAAPQQEAQ
ncbi:hypothetical protein ORA46_000204 [Enterobacter asburiae]|nr:hypothetical protein [Enterobacter asburiae]